MTTYGAMLKADLFVLAEKRGIEPSASDLKDELIDLLEDLDLAEAEIIWADAGAEEVVSHHRVWPVD